MSDVHQHYCRACQAPWTHDGEAIDKFDQKSIDEAHTCPRCGEQQAFYKYKGYESPEEIAMLEGLINAGSDDRLPEHVRHAADEDFRRISREMWAARKHLLAEDNWARVEERKFEARREARRRLMQILEGLQDEAAA